MSKYIGRIGRIVEMGPAPFIYKVAFPEFDEWEYFYAASWLALVEGDDDVEGNAELRTSYFYITDYGEVHVECDSGTDLDRLRRRSGNYFVDKCEADLFARGWRKLFVNNGIKKK